MPQECFKSGWENLLKLSFIAEPLRKVLVGSSKSGALIVSRSEIDCSDPTLQQMIDYGFLVPLPDNPGMLQVIITTEDFHAAAAPVTGSKRRPSFLERVTVTKQDISTLKEILAVNDGVTFFSRFIAPKIQEMDRCKAAILIALASGWDEADDRFRVHVLMYGKWSSGTGKTPLLKWLKRVGAAYIDALLATRAGITVDLRDGSPGILARYHQGVCAIDELDKMAKVDRDGILAALEDGAITYVSGNAEGVYPAEIIGIAGANSISYLTPEQLLRFDFRFHIEPYSIEQACVITDSISMNMGKPAEELPQLTLVKYLKWVRSRQATISDDVRKAGAEEIKNSIRRTKKTNVRLIESVWRVARAIARLNYRDVRLQDVKTAIMLLDYEKK
jgi:DNA replicative helicase MCM subunit Mcm2 (Cdc46/Mcm family)